MVIQKLKTSNTFLQWVLTTQRIIPKVNEITTQGLIDTLYSNTNINVSGNVNVGGNTTVTGLFILDGVVDKLNVAGNLVVDSAISSNNAEFLELNVVNNVASFNTTSHLNVGQNGSFFNDLDTDTFHTSNLVISGIFDISNTNVTVSNINAGEANIQNNIVFANNLSSNALTALLANFDSVEVNSLVIRQNTGTQNVTSTIKVGNDAYIYGNLSATNNVIFQTVGSVSVQTSNITILTGAAVNQIYETINASTAAVTVSDNVSKFLSYVLTF